MPSFLVYCDTNVASNENAGGVSTQAKRIASRVEDTMLTTHVLQGLEDMNRRDLQALAKVHGVKANLKTMAIIEELRKLAPADLDADFMLDEDAAASSTHSSSRRRPRTKSTSTVTATASKTWKVHDGENVDPRAGKPDKSKTKSRLREATNTLQSSKESKSTKKRTAFEETSIIKKKKKKVMHEEESQQKQQQEQKEVNIQPEHAMDISEDTPAKEQRKRKSKKEETTISEAPKPAKVLSAAQLAQQSLQLTRLRNLSKIVIQEAADKGAVLSFVREQKRQEERSRRLTEEAKAKAAAKVSQQREVVQAAAQQAARKAIIKLENDAKVCSTRRTGIECAKEAADVAQTAAQARITRNIGVKCAQEAADVAQSAAQARITRNIGVKCAQEAADVAQSAAQARMTRNIGVKCAQEAADAAQTATMARATRRAGTGCAKEAALIAKNAAATRAARRAGVKCAEEAASAAQNASKIRATRLHGVKCAEEAACVAQENAEKKAAKAMSEARTKKRSKRKIVVLEEASVDDDADTVSYVQKGDLGSLADFEGLEEEQESSENKSEGASESTGCDQIETLQGQPSEEVETICVVDEEETDSLVKTGALTEANDHDVTEMVEENKASLVEKVVTDGVLDAEETKETCKEMREEQEFKAAVDPVPGMKKDQIAIPASDSDEMQLDMGSTDIVLEGDESGVSSNQYEDAEATLSDTAIDAAKVTNEVNTKSETEQAIAGHDDSAMQDTTATAEDCGMELETGVPARNMGEVAKSSEEIDADLTTMKDAVIEDGENIEDSAMEVEPTESHMEETTDSQHNFVAVEVQHTAYNVNSQEGMQLEVEQHGPEETKQEESFLVEPVTTTTESQSSSETGSNTEKVNPALPEIVGSLVQDSQAEGEVKINGQDNQDTPLKTHDNPEVALKDCEAECDAMERDDESLADSHNADDDMQQNNDDAKEAERNIFCEIQLSQAQLRTESENAHADPAEAIVVKTSPEATSCEALAVNEAGTSATKEFLESEVVVESTEDLEIANTTKDALCSTTLTTEEKQTCVIIQTNDEAESIACGLEDKSGELEDNDGKNFVGEEKSETDEVAPGVNECYTESISAESKKISSDENVEQRVSSIARIPSIDEDFDNNSHVSLKDEVCEDPTPAGDNCQISNEIEEEDVQESTHEVVESITGLRQQDIQCTEVEVEDKNDVEKNLAEFVPSMETADEQRDNDASSADEILVPDCAKDESACSETVDQKDTVAMSSAKAEDVAPNPDEITSTLEKGMAEKSFTFPEPVQAETSSIENSLECTAITEPQSNTSIPSSIVENVDLESDSMEIDEVIHAPEELGETKGDRKNGDLDEKVQSETAGKAPEEESTSEIVLPKGAPKANDDDYVESSEDDSSHDELDEEYFAYLAGKDSKSKRRKSEAKVNLSTSVQSVVTAVAIDSSKIVTVAETKVEDDADSSEDDSSYDGDHGEDSGDEVEGEVVTKTTYISPVKASSSSSSDATAAAPTEKKLSTPARAAVSKAQEALDKQKELMAKLQSARNKRKREQSELYEEASAFEQAFRAKRRQSLDARIARERAVFEEALSANLFMEKENLIPGTKTRVGAFVKRQKKAEKARLRHQNQSKHGNGKHKHSRR